MKEKPTRTMPHGRRIGAFIELVGPGDEQIAIRHDGALRWRRRVLPIITVANVFPKERAVLLNIDLHALGSAPEAGPLPADEGAADPSREWRELVERYISPGEGEPNQASVESVEVANTERHLLFLSNSRGYVLVELDGSPPPLGQKIRVPEEQGSFLVAKVGPSPLPNDPRVCAYLEQNREIDEPNPNASEG